MKKSKEAFWTAVAIGFGLGLAIATLADMAFGQELPPTSAANAIYAPISTTASLYMPPLRPIPSRTVTFSIRKSDNHFIAQDENGVEVDMDKVAFILDKMGDIMRANVVGNNE